MSLPVASNIEIRNAVRRGLYRAPRIVIVDEAEIKKASVSRLQFLIEKGVVSPQRVEEVAPLERIAAPEKVKIARPTRAGDYVTGLSEGYVLRAPGNNSSFGNLVSTPSIPGPHILVEVLLTGGSEALLAANTHLLTFDVRYSAEPPPDGNASSYAQFELMKPVFTSSAHTGARDAARGGLLLTPQSGSLAYAFHLDKYIDEVNIAYTCRFLAYSVASQVWEYCAVLVVREVAAVERVSRLPSIAATRDVVIRAPRGSSKVRESRVDGAPVLQVPQAREKLYRIFLSDREYRVPESDLRRVMEWFNPLAVVPDEQADQERRRVHRVIPVFYKGLQPLPTVIGSTRLPRLAPPVPQGLPGPFGD